MRKLILKNSQSPGDIVMLTAAVRDLHRSYAGQFVTDVRTPCGQLWENNPHVTKLDEKEAQGEVIQCEYPLIHQSNQGPFHFIHGFTHHLSDRLSLNIRPTLFKGDIHLSAREKGWMSQVHEITRWDTPFWIVVAGGKYDFTAKWWSSERYQEVVDYFQGRILFVQVGEKGHHHPALSGVLNLIGRTDVRQFVRLMYHAQGVLCPVTFAMHLAAAVEVKKSIIVGHGATLYGEAIRPCVVVAGGREPSRAQTITMPHSQACASSPQLL